MSRTTIDPTLIARLSADFTSLGAHMGRLGGDLDVLRGQLEHHQRQKKGQVTFFHVELF